MSEEKDPAADSVPTEKDDAVGVAGSGEEVYKVAAPAASVAAAVAPAVSEEEAEAEDESEEEDEEDYIAPIRDSREVTISTCRLNPHIVCRMCDGYFRDPHTVVECLHTFCKTCLLVHFANGHTTCPHCNVSLGQRPIDGIRADRTLDTLVSKLFPHFKTEEIREEEEFHRRCDIPWKRDSSSLAASETAKPPKRQRATDQSLDMSFKLVPEEPDATDAYTDLEKPFLRTSKKLRVVHLKKYLAKKLGMDKTQDIEISCNGETLGEELSLEFIQKTRWHDEERDLVLNYRKRTLNLY